mmetsp:Transcript_10805/g.18116  ORF Transcript_10805/g.18116 Transcript_10805/m.18116 type:complete len:262 (+) Transcript_10805:9-794(+)
MGDREKRARIHQGEFLPGEGSAADQMTAAAELERVISFQEHLEDINDDVATKVLQLQREANMRRAPLYKSRRDAIRGVPNFWCSALLGHPLLERYIIDQDLNILEHLTELNVSENDDVKSGYTIELHFSPNIFFHNRKLTKELRYADDGDLRMRASSVDWKEETRDVSRESGGAVVSRQKRPHDAMVESRSFFLRAFLWLEGDDPAVLTPDEATLGASAVSGLLESEAFCEAIKDEVWSNPLKFYRRFTEEGPFEPGADDA